MRHCFSCRGPPGQDVDVRNRCTRMSARIVDATPRAHRRFRLLCAAHELGGSRVATKTKTSAKRKRAPVRRRTPKKAAPRTRGVLPMECKLDELPPAAAEVAARVEREGGLVIGSYCEPLGRNPLLLAALPIDRVEPTPFQRDLSDAHHKKLSGVIDKTGLFLDPVI